MRALTVLLPLLALSPLSSNPASARECREIPSLTALASATVNVNTESETAIAALLQDAETIFTEGAHIVRRAPRTEVESAALSRMEDIGHDGESFHVKECNFQNRISVVEAGKKRNPSERASQILIRVEQFDNFIFMAVGKALDFSNLNAAFDLKLSRQLLDHALMEAKGQTKQRDWDPADLEGPSISQKCADDWPHGGSMEQIAKAVDAQIKRYDEVKR